MKKNLLSLKLIFLMAVVNTSCGFDITKIHPSFLDVKRGYARIYEAVPVENPACGEPKFKFIYSEKNKPISEMSGYACIPVDEVQYMITIYNENIKKNANCPLTVKKIESF